MAKVSASIGLTLKLFKDSQFEFIRPMIEISEIDTESSIPIETQLEEAVKALEKTWDTVTNELNNQVLSEMPQVDAEMELQVSRKLQQFEGALKEFRKELATLKKG